MGLFVCNKAILEWVTYNAICVSNKIDLPVCRIAENIKKRVDDNAQPRDHIRWNMCLISKGIYEGKVVVDSSLAPYSAFWRKGQQLRRWQRGRCISDSL